jgi:hypothetical protein
MSGFSQEHKTKETVTPLSLGRATDSAFKMQNEYNPQPTYND